MADYTYIHIPKTPEYAKNLQLPSSGELMAAMRKRISLLRNPPQPTDIDAVCNLANECFIKLDYHFSNNRRSDFHVSNTEVKTNEIKYEGTLLSDISPQGFSPKLKSSQHPLFPMFHTEHFAPLISPNDNTIQYLPYLMTAFYWNTRGIYAAEFPAYLKDLLAEVYPSDKSRTKQTDRFMRYFSLEDEKQNFADINPENIHKALRKSSTENPSNQNQDSKKAFTLNLTLYQDSISCHYLMRRQEQIGLVPLIFEQFDTSFLLDQLSDTLKADIFDEDSMIPPGWPALFHTRIQTILCNENPENIASDLKSYLLYFFKALKSKNKDYFSHKCAGTKHFIMQWNILIKDLKKSSSSKSKLIKFANTHLSLPSYKSLQNYCDVQSNHDKLSFSSKHLYLAMIYSVCELSCRCVDDISSKVKFEGSYSLFQNHTQAFHTSLCHHPKYTLAQFILESSTHSPRRTQAKYADNFLAFDVSRQGRNGNRIRKGLHPNTGIRYLKTSLPMKSLCNLIAGHAPYVSPPMQTNLLILSFCIDSFNPLEYLRSRNNTSIYVSTSIENVAMKYDPLFYTYAPVFSAYGTFAALSAPLSPGNEKTLRPQTPPDPLASPTTVSQSETPSDRQN